MPYVPTDYDGDGKIYDVSCLYSTVKNISGVRKKFGFLPPHGRELDNNEEFTVFGDVRQAIIGGVERVTARRQILAFEAAIEAGWLEIMQTPSPIFEDQTTGNPRMLELDGGTLADIDPCWKNSISG